MSESTIFLEAVSGPIARRVHFCAERPTNFECPIAAARVDDHDLIGPSQRLDATRDRALVVFGNDDGRDAHLRANAISDLRSAGSASRSIVPAARRRSR